MLLMNEQQQRYLLLAVLCWLASCDDE